MARLNLISCGKAIGKRQSMGQSNSARQAASLICSVRQEAELEGRRRDKAMAVRAARRLGALSHPVSTGPDLQPSREELASCGVAFSRHCLFAGCVECQRFALRFAAGDRLV